ncbi:hypothetical protein MTR67_003316, partial [Solanum verrucosum]
IFYSVDTYCTSIKTLHTCLTIWHIHFNFYIQVSFFRLLLFYFCVCLLELPLHVFNVGTSSFNRENEMNRFNFLGCLHYLAF